MPKGRPSKFKPEMLRQTEILGGLGLTFQEIANVLDIKHSTFYRYIQTKPEFGDAVKKGADRANTKVVDSLYKSAINGNLGAQIFWLKNRVSDKWQDKQEFKHDVATTIVVERGELPDRNRLGVLLGTNGN